MPVADIAVRDAWVWLVECTVTTGGGTVHFVNHVGVPTYVGHDEEREEGGTPDIIGCIRCVRFGGNLNASLSSTKG